MSFLGKILKAKKTPEAAKEKKEKPVSDSIAPRSESPASGKIVLGVLRGPHVTEKAASFAGINVHVFRVTDHANKIQIKKAVEARYGVHVERVRVLAAHKKSRVRGKIRGWKPGVKKAMVRIKKGETIEIK